ncbi:MAG: hypothetical protein MUC67_08745 [Acidobacteria bacterium]|jgi:hypothetical protein|nr:hypothetical protein [Acidobacteriota bacterium]MCU0254569.1 hypothetical protein [Acidobacteriota bacterium]
MHRAAALVALLAPGLPGPFAAPPEPGPLRFLPGDEALAGAWGDQSPLDVARGGDGFLAVWGDARAYAGRNDVYGPLLDAAPIPLANPGESAGYTVASDGSSWAVLWAGTSAGNADLRGARAPRRAPCSIRAGSRSSPRRTPSGASARWRSARTATSWSGPTIRASWRCA